MKAVLTIIFVYGIMATANSQNAIVQSFKVPEWTEADRIYLLNNLIRSYQEILDETKNLTHAQYTFKEDASRWNINQIVEHIAIWELLFMRDISQALAQKPDSTFSLYPPDSMFIVDDTKGYKQNNALEYTKPFSFAIPLGNNEGVNNVLWFANMRNESIGFLKSQNRNIRLAYDKRSGRNVHHIYLMIIAHTDRHLLQIRKVKKHVNYPE